MIFKNRDLFGGRLAPAWGCRGPLFAVNELTPIGRQGNLTGVRVADSARKHGIADADMLHAAQNAVAAVQQGDRLLLIGAAHDGTLLEVVVLDPDNNPVLIHAMRLRPKFHRYLEGKG